MIILEVKLTEDKIISLLEKALSDATDNKLIKTLIKLLNKELKEWDLDSNTVTSCNKLSKTLKDIIIKYN